MQCRSHAAQLGRLYQEFKAAGCEILLVLGEPVEKASRYVDILHLPFPVLADPERSVYHRYGLEKALFVIQRTASIIIDRDGVIRYRHYTTSPMVWLDESRQLLQVVRALDPGNQSR